MNLHEEIAACDNRIAELKTERDTALESLRGMKEERDRFERMFVAACEDLALINEKLDLDPDDGGAEPIIAAIEELQGAQSAPAVKYGQDNPPRLRKPGESVEEYRIAMGWPVAPEAADTDIPEALELLAAVFDACENGDDCYEDPEECAGFLGKAFRLDDDIFNRCVELLNRRNPPRNAASTALQAPVREVPDLQPGVYAVIQLIQKQCSDYHSEHGSLDTGTGAWNYPGDGNEWMCDREELLDEIRALLPAAPVQEPKP